MKKTKTLSFLIIITIMLALVRTSVTSAIETEMPLTGKISNEDKRYSTATSDDSFADNCVLVIMTNTASLRLSEYGPADFSEINCEAVYNLSQTTTALIKATLASENADLYGRSTSGINDSDSHYVNIDNFNQILALELSQPSKENVLRAIELLEQRADVLYAGPNYIYSISSNDEDTHALYSTNPSDAWKDQQWALDMVSLPEAWNICTGMNHTVTVGVIDTGIDATHLDLMGKVNVSKSRLIDLNGNSVELTTVTDSVGHGTSVAGIIGARTNNNVGISGVNWNIELVSLQISTNATTTSTRAIAEALELAQQLEIPIVNMSLSIGMDGDTPILEYMVNQYEGLIVCAAGNYIGNIDDYDFYPASFESAKIIVVGASNDEDFPMTGSAYGSNTVDLFAPGEEILCCHPQSLCVETEEEDTVNNIHYITGYHFLSGTSMAAPYVTGVASLLKALDSSVTPLQIKYHILEFVDVKSAFNEKCVTGGRLNAYMAMATHSYSFAAVDSTYHYGTCVCGATKHEAHTWSSVGDMEMCMDCEYILQ